MIDDALLLVTQVGMFLFIVAGIAAVGLGLTVPRILKPLRDLRMVALLLVADFVAVPVMVIVLTMVGALVIPIVFIDESGELGRRLGGAPAHDAEADASA